MTGGKLPKGLRRSMGGDSVAAILSEGFVLCETCQMVCSGGTQKEQMEWLAGHDCRPGSQEPCTVCGGPCGPIFCWDKGHARD